VKALAAGGARLILTSRNLEAGEKARQEVKDSGAKVRLSLNPLVRLVYGQTEQLIN
jgi:hypothetical protein